MRTTATQRNIKAAVSKDTRRPALMHAYYDHDEKRLAVCDNYILILYPATPEEGDAESFLIPTEAFAKKSSRHPLLPL